jgi:hypothetical protein
VQTRPGNTGQKPGIKPPILKLKKIKIKAMKKVDYTLKAGKVTTMIKIDDPFCVLDVKD